MQTLPRMQELTRLLRHQMTRLMLLGVAVGLLGGLGAVLFEALSSGVSRLFFGQVDPSVAQPSLWGALLGPTLTGTLAGLLVFYLSRDRAPIGTPEVMAAVANDAGQLSLRSSFVTALAAAITLGGGGGGGREGPIMQLAAACAGKLCAMARLPPNRVRVLVAAGASAGIAASFNAPIAAAFFSMEILLGSFAMELFAPVVAATVTGTIIGQAFLGDRLVLNLPSYAVESPWEFVAYAALGVGIGLVSVLFQRGILAISALIDRSAVPRWSLGALFGLLTGILAAVGLPQVLGNGYGAIEQLLTGQSSLALLLLLMAAKIIVSGGFWGARTGVGLLSPILFVGAAAGTSFGLALKALGLPAADAGAYGIVGMGATLAAVTHGPITALMMLFEMTHDYKVILPLMLTLVVATLINRGLTHGSLYQEVLRLCGVELNHNREQLALYQVRVRDFMRADAPRCTPEQSEAGVVTAFLQRRMEHLYLVDSEGLYRGTVSLQQVKTHIRAPDAGAKAVDLLDAHVPTLGPDEPLAGTMPRYYRSGAEELPVVDSEGRFLGALSERDIMGAYQREVLRADALMAHVEHGAGQRREHDYVELPDGEVLRALVVAPPLSGHSIRELNLRQRFEATVICLSELDTQSGRLVRRHTDPDRLLQSGDKLVVMGPAHGIARLLGEVGEE